MELDIAPTVCRYDGCTLGPHGGPAPLVQPLRGGNIREYCSDRHRIAAHRARQRRPGPALVPFDGRHRPARVPGEAPPSAVAAALASVAADLGRLSAEVDQAMALSDADRVARELQDAHLRVAEAEARAAATAAERDREQAAAAGFREMAEANLTAAERATTRADDAEAARDAATEALTAAEAARDGALSAQAAAEEAHAAARAALEGRLQDEASARAKAERRAQEAVSWVKEAERRVKAAGSAAENAERRAERAEGTVAAAEERVRAAEALRDAALREARTERARAEEALAARRDLAAALAGPTSRQGGRESERKTHRNGR